MSLEMSPKTRDGAVASRILNGNCYLGMFAMGSLTGAIGPLLVYIIRFYRLDFSVAGLPIVFDAAGYFAGTFSVSFLWSLERARTILWLSSIAMLLVLMGIVITCQHFALFLILLFCLGLASGFLNVGIDSLFSEVHRAQRARYLTLAHLFFGIGAFTGPLLVILVQAVSDKWYLYYLVMGILFIPIVFVFTHKPIFPHARTVGQTADGSRRDGRKELLVSFPFWAFLLIMFFSLGVEIAFSSWTPLYLTEIRKTSDALGGYSISAFWLALIAGRLIFYRIAHRIDLTLSLIAGSLGSALFISMLYISGAETAILLFAALTGFVYSVMYPIILAVGTGCFPRQAGFVTGAISTSGAVGCIFFPWIMGPVSQSMGLSKSVFCIPVMCLMMAGITALFFSYQQKTNLEAASG